MKFSMIFEAQVELGTPDVERRAIHNCVEQAVYAEEMGFDGVWAVEHHSLIEYSHMSAPEIFLTAVAAKTERIRVGHAAVCMPFGYNHPVRVAERAAMLDIISNGRLNLGAARGGTAQEMSLCGVRPEDTKPQVAEALRFIGHCWRGETIEWDSDLLQIHSPPDRPTHTVVPRPVQMPHPPLFLACTNPETVRTAARYGVGPMVLGFGGPEAIGEMRKAFDDERAQRDPDAVVSPGHINDEFVALCPTFLMDDREEARRIGARALRFFAEAISHWSAPNGVAPARGTDQVDNIAYMQDLHQQARDAMARGEAPPTAASSMYNLDHALGDADTAISYVERLEDAGVDNCMCLIQMGTLTQEQQLNTIRIFGEQVIPHFRAETPD
ncbi:MAG: LLM class flavin-dependent oxidoreductase [Acidimicrobiia bacterium]|jgi:alkanesulfonate monooxygenase SsuD/methylene tetrahydromethanopterin reductase-like flavin-dependent oxidoreductase (luciferase family)